MMSYPSIDSLVKKVDNKYIWLPWLLAVPVN